MFFKSAFCTNCQRNLRVDNEVFVHYITFPLVVLACYPISDFPNYIITQNALRGLQCEYDRLCNVTSSVTDIGNFLFWIFFIF